MDNCRVILPRKGRHTFGFILLKIVFLDCWDRIKHRPLPRGPQQQPAAILSGHRSHHFRPLLLPTPAPVLAAGTEAPEQPTLRLPETRSRRRAAAGLDREISRRRRLPLKSRTRPVSRPIESLRITVQQQTRGSQIM